MEDDTAIGFKTEKGAVVVAGCAHSGICNIATRAREVTGQNLHAVIGGFHMMKAEEPPIDETINWFREQSVEMLLPMHCVEFEYLKIPCCVFHAQTWCGRFDRDLNNSSDSNSSLDDIGEK
jgi:7,8-dihydropterin-6-yl-methyl-4-(beta-D-ribofuranosyl)aminobenzene 5'-phosphate synthase